MVFSEEASSPFPLMKRSGAILLLLFQTAGQSKWILSNWSDELIGGATRITYFGGSPQAAGNWEYLLDSHSPRPLASTIAVFTSKMYGAKPLGKFFLPGQGVFYLFEKNGKSLLIAASANAVGESVSLDLGTEGVTVTDHQGNETSIDPNNGKTTLDLKPLGVIVEGGDLDFLKLHLMLKVGADREPTAFPQVVVMKNKTVNVPMTVFNPYPKPLALTPVIGGADGWTSSATAVELAPGERRAIEVSVAVPTTATGTIQLTAHVENPGGTNAPKIFGITLISPEMVGNLLENGDFEAPGTAGSKAPGWGLNKSAQIVPAPGGLGVGENCVKFSGNAWASANQNIKPPAHDLLYTAWIWSQGMKQSGSNVGLQTADGKSKTLMVPAVFDAGAQTPFWRLVSKRINVPADLVGASFTPVAIGDKFALYDNLRVTLYDGTNFATEAAKVTQAPEIDGKLDDWQKVNPIPLLADNQLTKHDPSYDWTPDNCAGVAYLAWDEKALYLSAEVRDNILSAPSTGDETTASDSLTVAIHPANRAPGKDEKAFQYQISPALPGGGSGKNTLYRPSSKSGGLASGQLAKDSSNYEIAIVRNGDITTYEVRLPWSELGGIQPSFGAKFGLSLELNDNDGKGRAASMHWGEGLQPAWNPRGFGVAILVE